MNLEFFPNEILIECFEYLNAFEIFYSFDQLNYRFSKLIRTISLYLNFQHIRKSIFDQFCTILQSNPELKNQIYSLKLSNKETCGQIDIFLSFFSLDQFVHLRSLTLIQIEQNHLEKFKSTLPFLYQLYSFQVFDTKNVDNDLFILLPMSNLRRLSIPTLPIYDQTSILTHLSISSCSLDQLLSSLFKYAPLLKYLSIENIYKASYSILNSLHYPAIHLKQLIINNFEYFFEEFQILIKLIPNLKHLTISALDNIDMINADQWKYLIQSSLSYLKVFHFTFGLYCRGKIRDDIIEKFQLFQTDFWWKQHQWFIEYVFDINSAVIYTVPYVSNTYRLSLFTGKYSNLLKDNCHRFDNVRDLTICYEAKQEICTDYFSNIRILRLKMNSKHEEKQILGLEYIRSLQMIINFNYLKHLDISSYCTIETLALIEICKQASQLSSITINPWILSILFDDNELCEYLNRMIKKLNVYKFGQNSFKNSNEIEQFCQRFSNLEQLICEINQLNQLLILLNQTSKLSMITIFLTSSDNFDDWFKNEALKFNLIYRINYSSTYADGPRELYKTELSIWTGGKRVN